MNLTRLRNKIAKLVEVANTEDLIISVHPGGYLTGVDIHNSPDRAVVAFNQSGGAGFNVTITAPVSLMPVIDLTRLSNG